MRAHHILAVVTVVFIGLALKQFLFAPEKAQAGIPPEHMDVMQMHLDHPNITAMKVDRMHDMQTVFTNQE